MLPSVVNCRRCGKPLHDLREITNRCHFSCNAQFLQSETKLSAKALREAAELEVKAGLKALKKRAEELLPVSSFAMNFSDPENPVHQQRLEQITEQSEVRLSLKWSKVLLR